MTLGSLFSNWFGSSKSSTPEAPAPNPGLDKRMAQRREAVEQAVSEAMADAGVVSSVYRREVRSLDERGHQFQVTIDLPKELAVIPVNLLAQVGLIITRKARSMNAGDVMGVYWQVVHDAHAKSSEPLNLMAAARSQQSAPEAPPEPSAAELSAQRVARLREMMKDDHAPKTAAAHQSDDESDQGFANTVIGYGDDTPRGGKP